MVGNCCYPIVFILFCGSPPRNRGRAGRIVMKRTKGFTLVELLVVVAIIALLVSILLPTLSRAKELTKRTICGTNLKGIGSSAFIYASDSDDFFPVAPAVMYTGGSAYDKWSGKTDGTWRIIAPSKTNDTVSVTASQWIFVRNV